MVAVTLNDYIDRDMVKQALFLTTAEWDGYLDLLIGAAADAVSRHADRQFLASQEPEGRYFDGRSGMTLDIDDAVSVSSFKVDTSGDGDFGVALIEGVDFDLYPLNSVPKFSVKLRKKGQLSSFPPFGRSVEVVARWGWPAVPDVVRESVLLTASRWFKRRDTGYGDAYSGESGLLDSDVVAMLAPYRRRTTGRIKVLFP